MKEFIEHLKLYKEYVITMIALVGGCVFIASYFATKEALTTSKQDMISEINMRECWLNNRITVSEVAAAISALEKELLEKRRLRMDLTLRPEKSLEPAEKLYNKEMMEQIGKDFLRIDEELKAYRITAKVAAGNLMNASCNKILEEKK